MSIKLLVILFIIKLYARNNIFKTSYKYYLTNKQHVTELFHLLS